jgi:hypothetical protein
MVRIAWNRRVTVIKSKDPEQWVIGQVRIGLDFGSQQSAERTSLLMEGEGQA